MLHMARSNSAEASLKIGHEGAALSRTRMPANAPEIVCGAFWRRSRVTISGKTLHGQAIRNRASDPEIANGPNRDHNGQNRYGKKARPDRSPVRAGHKNHIRPRAALDP